MAAYEAYTFNNLLNNPSAADLQRVRDLWLAEKAFSDHASMDTRARQVVIMVDHNGRAAGVSTAEKKRVKLLNNNNLYEFRCLISSSHRLPGLDVKLTLATLEALEKAAQSDPDPCIGMFAILENEQLKQQTVWRRAVWPEVHMVFMGYTSSGHPIRVRYFKNARV